MFVIVCMDECVIMYDCLYEGLCDYMYGCSYGTLCGCMWTCERLSDTHIDRQIKQFLNLN